MRCHPRDYKEFVYHSSLEGTEGVNIYLIVGCANAIFSASQLFTCEVTNVSKLDDAILFM